MASAAVAVAKLDRTCEPFARLPSARYIFPVRFCKKGCHERCQQGFLRRADRWLVAVAMAALALILEWFVIRSVRGGAKTGPTAQSHR